MQQLLHLPFHPLPPFHHLAHILPFELSSILADNNIQNVLFTAFQPFQPFHQQMFVESQPAQP